MNIMSIAREKPAKIFKLSAIGMNSLEQNKTQNITARVNALEEKTELAEDDALAVTARLDSLEQTRIQSKIDMIELSARLYALENRLYAIEKKMDATIKYLLTIKKLI